MIEGVNLADGYSIRSFARMGRRHISSIRPYMHSLRGYLPPGRPRLEFPGLLTLGT